MKLINDFFVISSSNETEFAFKFIVNLNAEHYIYKAHFPGNPITPGVCMIQMAKELLESKMNRVLYIKKIVNIKYLNILVPTQENSVSVAFERLNVSEKDCSAHVLINGEEQSYAKMSLIFSYEQI